MKVSFKKILSILLPLVMLCFWACTTNETGGDQYLAFKLSETLKGYDRVLIRLINTNDTGTAYDTVWNAKLPDPSSITRYKLKQAKGKNFTIQIRGFNNDQLLWSKDVVVKEGKPESPTVPVSDLRLFDLKVSQGDLTPKFDFNTASYTVAVEESIDNIVLTLDPMDTTNVLKINEKALHWGATATQPLAIGDNTFNISVQTKFDNNSKNYKLTVTRGARPFVVDTTHVTSLKISKDSLVIYKGETAPTLTATVSPVGTVLHWISLNDAVVSVDQQGKLTAVDSGTTKIIVKAGKDSADTAVVKVIKDVPLLNVGNNIGVKPNVEVTFNISVTQNHGTYAVFKYDLEGDGNWDNADSLSGTPPTILKHSYTIAKTYTALFYVRDSEGNSATATRTINVTNSSVSVTIIHPKTDTMVNKSTINLQYTVNGQLFTKQAKLKDGLNIVRVDTTIGTDKGSDSIKVTLDTIPPVIKIASPTDSSFTKASNISVTWTVDDQAQSLQLTEDLGTTDGLKIITRNATDAAGNVGAKSIRVYRLTKGPIVKINSPAEGFISSQNQAKVTWSVNGADQKSDTLATLKNGSNTITRAATDGAGNTSIDSVHVTYNALAPKVLITSPKTSSYTNQTAIAVVWTVDGKVQDSAKTENLSIEGNNTITRSFKNADGVVGNDVITVIRDTQKPVVKILTTPNTLTNQNSMHVDWQVDNQAQTLDTTEPLPVDGFRTITRKSTDAAGNTDSNSITVRRDATKPLAPSVTIAAALTNASATWNWTSNGDNFGGAGLVTPTAAYRYSLNGSAFAPIAGNTLTLANLPEGQNKFVVQEKDLAGNWSDSSNVGVVTVDRTPKKIALVYPSATGFITSRTSFVVRFTEQDGANAPVARTQDVPTLVTGPNSVKLMTTADAAGNKDSLTISIYSQPPAIFVRATAPAGGNGTSWDSAFTTIDAAMNVAKATEQIWVSAAAYTISAAGVNSGMDVKTGVSLYGGFAATGYPNTLAGRNPTANVTSVQANAATSNTYIFNLEYASNNVTIDGFKFIGKNNMSAIASNATTSLSLTQCKFTGFTNTDYIIHLSGGSVTLTNDTISGNNGSIGIIVCRNSVTFKMKNSAVINNTVPVSTTYSALSIWEVTFATIDFCTFSGNKSGSKAQQISYLDASMSFGPMDISNSIIEGGAAAIPNFGWLTYESNNTPPQ